jgi:hypothetical protein
VTYVCWTIDHTLYQPMCKQMNRTAVCTAEGSWEPNSDNICDDSIGIILIVAWWIPLIGAIPFTGTNGLNQNETIVVTSIIVFVVTSSIFFFIGYLCGHFCRKQSPVSTALAPSVVDHQENDPQPRRREEKLELQTNVAYASVQWPDTYMYIHEYSTL